MPKNKMFDLVYLIMWYLKTKYELYMYDFNFEILNFENFIEEMNLCFFVTILKI